MLRHMGGDAIIVRQIAIAQVCPLVHLIERASKMGWDHGMICFPRFFLSFNHC